GIRASQMVNRDERWIPAVPSRNLASRQKPASGMAWQRRLRGIRKNDSPLRRVGKSWLVYSQPISNHTYRAKDKRSSSPVFPCRFVPDAAAAFGFAHARIPFVGQGVAWLRDHQTA